VAAGAALFVPGAEPWAVGSVVLNHLGLTAAGLWPRSRVLGANVTRLPAGSASSGAVAITIDDGPDPAVTPAVLDLLDTLGARATFFCIAQRAAQHPVLVREIVARGHDVQNHSDGHRHDFSLSGPARLQREIGAAQARLADITGRLPHAFRAPAGLRNPLLLVSWTRRGFDTRDADPARVLARLERGLAGGDILLLHDGHARRTAAGRPVLLDVLPPLLARLRAAGLHTATLQAALPPRHPTP
jgi:peptidoglycan/xylan/chitin deacetylase (PgdA/CDA1 family)